VINKSSRRAFISATAASFAWLVTGGRASAAAPMIKAGAPCKAKGKERTIDGVTFVCKTVKGKLVWRQTPTVAKEKLITVRVLESASLELGATKIVDVPMPTGGVTGVVVTRTSAGITALSVSCTHAGFAVVRDGAVLYCGLHGSQFEPTTGNVLAGPATRALPRYEASETNGGIYVTVSGS